MVVKDFKENDTGLEYIGTRKQQMGDGGVIAQFITSSGALAAVTDGNWRCLVTHDAPSSKSCEQESNPIAGVGTCGFSEFDEPEGWKAVGFDDSGWAQAVEYSELQVGPKDDYDQIHWDLGARLIWGDDLETNNSLLCRMVVN